MIIFNVVKEEHGWAVRMADHMTTPFWSRESAILEANSLAKAIRCHGQCAEVNIERMTANEQIPEIHEQVTSWSDTFSWRRRAATQ